MTQFSPFAREAVRSLRASKIREVANAGLGREDVLAFWFGEPDEVTPAFIRQAGIDALNAGAMYAFFRVEGVADSLAFCKRLVAEAGLGLAPGIAFGPEGEGFVRWCFAASEVRLAEGIERLQRHLARREPASVT